MTRPTRLTRSVRPTQTRRHGLAVRAPLSALLLLLASSCGTASTPPSPVPDSAAPSATSTLGSNASGGAVRIEISGRSIRAELNTTATAQDLRSQLPLTLDLVDYNADEKVADLPRPLSTEGVPAAADPEVNDLGYYQPQRRLVFYHGNVGSFPGIVRIGRMGAEDRQFVASQPADVRLTLSDGGA